MDMLVCAMGARYSNIVWSDVAKEQHVSGLLEDYPSVCPTVFSLTVDVVDVKPGYVGRYNGGSGTARFYSFFLIVSLVLKSDPLKEGKDLVMVNFY